MAVDIIGRCVHGPITSGLDYRTLCVIGRAIMAVDIIGRGQAALVIGPSDNVSYVSFRAFRGHVR